MNKKINKKNSGYHTLIFINNPDRTNEIDREFLSSVKGDVYVSDVTKSKIKDRIYGLIDEIPDSVYYSTNDCRKGNDLTIYMSIDNYKSHPFLGGYVAGHNIKLKSSNLITTNYIYLTLSSNINKKKKMETNKNIITSNEIMNGYFEVMKRNIETFEFEDNEDLNKFIKEMYRQVICAKEMFNIIYK